MLSAMILAISIVALAQFALYYWRAVVTGVAAQPVSGQVLAAARLDTGILRGDDYRSLAELHKLTADLHAGRSSLGLVPLYFKIIQAIGTLASGRIAGLADWAESERNRLVGAFSPYFPEHGCLPSQTANEPSASCTWHSS